jgi:hypothetical protein
MPRPSKVMMDRGLCGLEGEADGAVEVKHTSPRILRPSEAALRSLPMAGERVSCY